MDDIKYYGILMNRISIIPGIYFFKPVCLVEGTKEDDKDLFIDNTNQVYYIGNSGDSLSHDSTDCVLYIISEEDLLNKYNGIDIRIAKSNYCTEVYSNIHIGYYIEKEDRIELFSYDLDSVFKRLNTGESMRDIATDLVGEKFDVTVDEKDFSRFDDEEALLVLGVSDLEKLLEKKNFEDLHSELEKIYNGIKLLRDTNGIESKVSIPKKFGSGEEIIDLFTDSYDFLLEVENLDTMKELLTSVKNVYNELYLSLDTQNTNDNIEAARDFLLVFIDAYDKMLNMDSLDKIKDQINKLKESEEEHILGVAQIYNEQNGVAKESKEEVNSNASDHSMESLICELHSLIGLSNIKELIENLTIYLDYINRTRESQNLDNPALNMVFKGNPGTGKTTIARIVAKLLYKLGYVKKDSFVEITKQGLIAGFVGQTALKTKKLIDENKGGVIFLDEAYSLCSEGDSFAEDAIGELLKEMDNKETIFIFAGYEDEMNNFIKINPGLMSRIGYIIDFADYSLDELFQILNRKLTMHNLCLSDEAIEEVKIIINNKKGEKNFGNGRYINHLFDKILMNHARNCKDIDAPEILKIISVDDLQNVEDKVKEKSIGFKA